MRYYKCKQELLVNLKLLLISNGRQGLPLIPINNESIHECLGDFLLKRVNAFLLPILLPIRLDEKEKKMEKGSKIYFKTLVKHDLRALILYSTHNILFTIL